MERYYRTTTAQQTGTKVTTGHADDLGLDDGDGATRWYNRCDAHDEIIGHETLARARSHASDPIGWCEPCAAEFDGNGTEVAG